MRIVMDRIQLTPEEMSALDEAHKIVAERAAQEHGEYDKEMLEWWLLGRLNGGDSIEEMLEWAKTAPFQSKKTNNRGYA